MTLYPTKYVPSLWHHISSLVHVYYLVTWIFTVNCRVFFFMYMEMKPSINTEILISFRHWYYAWSYWELQYRINESLIVNIVMCLRYDGWCICMGLCGRLHGPQESVNCYLSNEWHLHSCLKLLSDVRTVHAFQVSQRSCVSMIGSKQSIFELLCMYERMLNIWTSKL